MLFCASNNNIKSFLVLLLSYKEQQHIVSVFWATLYECTHTFNAQFEHFMKQQQQQQQQQIHTIQPEPELFLAAHTAIEIGSSSNHFYLFILFLFSMLFLYLFDSSLLSFAHQLRKFCHVVLGFQSKTQNKLAGKILKACLEAF